jgi:hypothetical protein
LGLIVGDFVLGGRLSLVSGAPEVILVTPQVAASKSLWAAAPRVVSRSRVWSSFAEMNPPGCGRCGRSRLVVGCHVQVSSVTKYL